MAWRTIDRKAPPAPVSGGPLLSDAVKDKIRAFFPRYETKRAVMLPALHVIQDEYNHISWQAMQELGELLEVPASDVFDTVSFYTFFWTQPRGKKVVTVCRSISCEVMGAGEVLAACKHALGIDEHQTTSDGKYSLATEECLAVCDHAPCMYVNERCYKRVRPDQVKAILADPKNDELPMERSDLFDGPTRSAAK